MTTPDFPWKQICKNIFIIKVSHMVFADIHIRKKLPAGVES